MSNVTAQGWFALGERVPYDPRVNRILRPGDTTDSPDVLHVFQRVVRDGAPSKEAVWATFLPGFPDGSFGWGKVDEHQSANGMVPKLYVEFVGQGDSDKPAKYRYGTMERSDLVEATWEAEGIRSTFVVTFDYSSLVALELLSRRQERVDRGADPSTKIVGVLLINGGLFADAHNHPLMTTERNFRSDQSARRRPLPEPRRRVPSGARRQIRGAVGSAPPVSCFARVRLVLHCRQRGRPVRAEPGSQGQRTIRRPGPRYPDGAWRPYDDP